MRAAARPFRIKVSDSSRAEIKKKIWPGSGLKPCRNDSNASPPIASGNARNMARAGGSRKINQLSNGTSTTARLVIKAPSPRVWALNRPIIQKLMATPNSTPTLAEARHSSAFKRRRARRPGMARISPARVKPQAINSRGGNPGRASLENIQRTAAHTVTRNKSKSAGNNCAGWATAGENPAGHRQAKWQVAEYFTAPLACLYAH